MDCLNFCQTRYGDFPTWGRVASILANRASTWPRDHFCRSTIAPRVAHHISCQDCCESPLRALFGHADCFSGRTRPHTTLWLTGQDLASADDRFGSRCRHHDRISHLVICPRFPGKLQDRSALYYVRVLSRYWNILPRQSAYRPSQSTRRYAIRRRWSRQNVSQ